MTTNKLQGWLQVKDLELKVNLGWRDKEQLEPQAILCNFEILFENEPSATLTDNLADTICYDNLIKKIRQQIADKKYRLIEHLAKEIYNIVKANLPQNTHAKVTIAKKPKIEGLLGGVTYTVS